MTVDELIASRVAFHRSAQGLSLAALAEVAGVSKATISKIERRQTSPTAAILGRLAAGLGVPLTELLAEEPAAPGALCRRAEQELWRDPATGYSRRQVAGRDPASGTELVEIQLPAGARVSYPRWNGTPYRQRLWLVEGTLEVRYGEDVHRLARGDRLDFGVDRPLAFAAPGRSGCRYLLLVLHG